MKTLFTCLVFLCVCVSAWAQDSYPKLEGIGKFKVNIANLSLVEEISNELKCKVEMINSSQAYYQFAKESPKIYQIAPNDGTIGIGQPPESSSCEGVEVFYINRYSVSGVPMSEIFLTFKDGLLVKFKCEPTTEFRDAIKAKYGSGELETDKKTVSCVTKLTGVTTEYEETTYRQKWENGGVNASLTLMVYYNDKCQKRYLNLFSINDVTADKQIFECESQNRKKATQAKEQDLKKKLSDF